MLDIKIKDTSLDRRIKVDETDKKLIKLLRKEDYTVKEIADFLGVSTSAVRYHSLDEIKKEEVRRKSRESKKKWYDSLTKDQKTNFSRSWRESRRKYDEELLLTKYNNMN